MPHVKPRATIQNHLQDSRLVKLEKSISGIKNNELPHLTQDVNDVKECLAEAKTDLAVVKTNVDWLMKLTWIVIGSSIGGLLTGLISLFFNIKK